MLSFNPEMIEITKLKLHKTNQNHLVNGSETEITTVPRNNIKNYIKLKNCELTSGKNTLQQRCV